MQEPTLIYSENEDFIRGLSSHPASLTEHSAQGCMMLFLVPFILAGAFLWMASLKMLYDDALLTWDSISTWGNVVGKYDYYDEGVKYSMTYRFTENNLTYYHSQGVNEVYYYTYDVGDVIPIKHARIDAHISRIEGTSSGGMSLFLLGFTGVWSLFVGAVFYAVVIGGWQQMRLRKEGVLVLGELHNIQIRKDSDGDIWTEVAIGFAVPQTEQYIRGRRKYMTTPKKMAKGDIVAIFYKNPSVWEVL